MESTPGKEAVFSSPLHSGGEAEEANPQRNDVNLDGIHTLVVDDNPTNRRVLVETLRGWNMRPAAASSGAEALEMLHRGFEQGDPFCAHPDRAHMPEMDGFDVHHESQSDAAIPAAHGP